LDIGKRALVGLAIALSIGVGPISIAHAGSTKTTKTERWVASWATSQMIPAAKDSLPAADVTNGTLRQTLRLSTGGGKIRVRLSNAFGTEPLKLSGARRPGRRARFGSHRCGQRPRLDLLRPP
jgi:hypothetical protein